MSKQTQGTMLMVGALASTIGLVAFVALMVMGDYAFSPAMFLAFLVAGAAALFLTVGFHRKSPPNASVSAEHTRAPVPHAAPPSTRAPTVPSAASAPTAKSSKKSTASKSKGSGTKKKTAKSQPAKAQSTTSADAEVGTRPESLSEPRGGSADDLKKIKGVGPKLEDMCNSLGFYHFEQIAGWSDDEVAWVDENIEGFKGRVSRDNWVEQARTLASGDETEFSQKVDKGGVY